MRPLKIGAVIGVAAAAACAMAGTVTFTEETGVIRNPGQGWSTMGGKWSFDQSDPVVNVGSVYCRFFVDEPRARGRTLQLEALGRAAVFRRVAGIAGVVSHHVREPA